MLLKKLKNDPNHSHEIYDIQFSEQKDVQKVSLMLLKKPLLHSCEYNLRDNREIFKLKFIMPQDAAIFIECYAKVVAAALKGEKLDTIENWKSVEQATEKYKDGTGLESFFKEKCPNSEPKKQSTKGGWSWSSRPPASDRTVASDDKPEEPADEEDSASSDAVQSARTYAPSVSSKSPVFWKRAPLQPAAPPPKVTLSPTSASGTQSPPPPPPPFKSDKHSFTALLGGKQAPTQGGGIPGPKNK